MVDKVIGLEFVHKDNYSIALEVSRKFVNKSDSRPIINYVFHSANGDMIATDSHRLIHLKNMHGFERDYLINPSTFMVARGKYPDTEKLSELTDKHKNLIELDKDQIRLWLQLFKSINQTLKVLKDRMKVVRLNFNNVSDHVEVELKNHDIKMTLPCTRNGEGEFDSISFSAEYMRDALEAHNKLNSEKINLWFLGSMRPFVLDDTENVRTLILPVRTY